MSTPYFQDVFYNAARITFEHLEPFTFAFDSQKAKRTLRIHVTFSNHCFTRTISEENPADNSILFDTHTDKPRVFCPIRYENSKRLRTIIEGQLNQSQTKVIQTNSQRNWVYSIQIESPTGPYHMFFSVSRANADKGSSQKTENKAR